MRYSGKQRRLALVIAMAVVLITVLSLLVLREHEDHDCGGEACEICCQLNWVRSLLKQLYTGGWTAALAALLLLFTPLTITPAPVKGLRPTPVHQKVRLNC